MLGKFNLEKCRSDYIYQPPNCELQHRHKVVMLSRDSKKKEIVARQIVNQLLVQENLMKKIK
jgi:hypothetical protein